MQAGDRIKAITTFYLLVIDRKIKQKRGAIAFITVLKFSCLQKAKKNFFKAKT